MSKSNKPLLTEFLSAPERPQGTLNYHQLQGFLFAICCSPEIIKPSEWMPLIFNEEDANYASIDEAQLVLAELMVIYNQINEQAFEIELQLPVDIQLDEVALKNVGEEVSLGQWSSGFSLGHDWLTELWRHYTPDSLDEELGSSLMVLTLFSNKKLAQAYYDDLADGAKHSLETFVDLALSSFGEAMRSYAHLAYSIQSAIADQNDVQKQPIIKQGSVGRNDPCPCGSGKKYKKCCLH